MGNVAEFTEEQTGLFEGWIADIMALGIGFFWFYIAGHGASLLAFEGRNTLGYVLLLVGILTFPMMILATVSAWTGHSSRCRYVTAFVQWAIPIAMVVGWIGGHVFPIFSAF